MAVRVQQGGHDVPAEIVERRFWRGLRNFFGLYRPIADTWVVCDNSGEELVIVARGSQGVEPTVFQSEAFARIKGQAAHAA